MARTADDHYNEALSIRDRILSGSTNERLVQAWASVCRECAKANDKYWAELGGRVHGRAQQAFFANLDRVWWNAKAQVETLAKMAA